MQKGSNFLINPHPVVFENGSLLAFNCGGKVYYPPSHQANRLHFHSCLEIGVCTKGSGIFYIGNRVFPFSAGDVSVITPNTLHIAQSSAKNPGGWRFFNVNLQGLAEKNIVDKELISGFFSGAVKSSVIYKGSQPKVFDICNSILKEADQRREYFNDSVLALTVLLIVTLARINTRDDGMTFSFSPLDLQEILPAIYFLLENYSRKIDIDSLCHLCNMSLSNFRRKFKAAFGMPPAQYLYTIRIKAATGLLRGTNLPISEIAGMVGYDSLSSFLRHFGRIMNMSPGQYRKTAASNGDNQDYM